MAAGAMEQADRSMGLVGLRPLRRMPVVLIIVIP